MKSAAKRAADAKRAALCRKRRNAGLVQARSWVPGRLVDWLIATGALTQEQADDPARLGEVILERALKQLAEEINSPFASQRDDWSRII